MRTYEYLEPSAKELGSLRQFVSTDTSRPHLSTLWKFVSDGGTTYVAMDGHTLAVRHSGTNREMLPTDIEQLQPEAVQTSAKAAPPLDCKPLSFSSVLLALNICCIGRLATKYSVSPIYFGRLAKVEASIYERESADAEEALKSSPRAVSHSSGERFDKKRQCTVDDYRVSLTIPSDNLSGWYWSIDVPSAKWEGVIMPRRP